MEQIRQQLEKMQSTWEEVQPNVLANRAAWPALDESVPDTITLVLDGLVAIIQDVSDATLKGRAIRLAMNAVSSTLTTAQNSLNNVATGNYAQFGPFAAHLGQSATAAYGLYILGSKDGEDVMKEACLRLSGLTKETEAIHRQLQEARGSVMAAQDELSEYREQAKGELADLHQHLANAETAHDETQQFKVAAEQALTDINEKQTTIEELAAGAKLLESGIQGGLEKVETLSQDLEEKVGWATEVKQQLEALLPGATSNRLAEAYTQEKTRVEGRMKVQFRWFVGGLLAVVGLITLGHQIFGALPTEPVALALQLLSRALLVSPAVWFTWVSARQYTYLTKLHTDYSFKESVSTSFYGFQQMMQELDEAGNKDLTSLLSVDTIRVIASDPERLHQKGKGDDSPLSHLMDTLADRVFRKKKTESAED